MAAPLEYGRLALDFAEEVDRVSDPDQVVNSVQRVMIPFGLELFSIIAWLPSPKEHLDRIVLARLTPDMAEWLKIYEDEEYSEVDPIVRRLRYSVTPLEHAGITYDSEPRALELRQRRRDFGFAKGLSVPIFGPNGRIGYVRYAIFKGLKPNLTAHKKRAFHFMTLYAFDRFYRLRALQSATKRILTNRQREVLTWAAAGKSAWETGESYIFPAEPSKNTRNRPSKAGGGKPDSRRGHRHPRWPYFYLKVGDPVNFLISPHSGV